MRPGQLLWITWERQLRNRSLSARLDARLLEIEESGSAGPRYVRSILRTFPYLWRWRRQALVVQNPSLVLALFALACKPLLRYHLVVDAHNAGIDPGDGTRAWLGAMANFVNRHADAVIVSNAALADRVRALGGRPIVLPDPLPSLPLAASLADQAAGGTTPGFRVLFVCTWASDEPYLEVFAAAEALPDATVWVTGNSRGREAAYGKPLPANVVLLGFVPEERYYQLLSQADAVLDLTTREDCLVCGAYEAVAAERPFVLSDTAALRGYFRQGGVHVANDAAAIARGLRTVLDRNAEYRRAVAGFREQLEAEWQLRFDQVRGEIAP